MTFFPWFFTPSQVFLFASVCGAILSSSRVFWMWRFLSYKYICKQSETSVVSPLARTVLLLARHNDLPDERWWRKNESSWGMDCVVEWKWSLKTAGEGWVFCISWLFLSHSTCSSCFFMDIFLSVGAFCMTAVPVMFVYWLEVETNLSFMYIQVKHDEFMNQDSLRFCYK